MKRRLFGFAVSLMTAFAASAVAATPAQASAASFSVSHYHGGGATLIVRIEGTFTWHNRSVSLNNVRLYVRAGYCASGSFEGHSANNYLWDYGWVPTTCAGSVNRWFDLDPVTLAGGQSTDPANQAITRVDIVPEEVDAYGNTVHLYPEDERSYYR